MSKKRIHGLYRNDRSIAIPYKYYKKHKHDDSKSNLIRRYKNANEWKKECKRRKIANELRELKEKASFKPRTILRKTKPVAVVLTEGVSNETSHRRFN